MPTRLESSPTVHAREQELSVPDRGQSVGPGQDPDLPVPPGLGGRGRVGEESVGTRGRAEVQAVARPGAVRGPDRRARRTSASRAPGGGRSHRRRPGRPAAPAGSVRPPPPGRRRRAPPRPRRPAPVDADAPRLPVDRHHGQVRGTGEAERRAEGGELDGGRAVGIAHRRLARRMASGSAGPARGTPRAATDRRPWSSTRLSRPGSTTSTKAGPPVRAAGRRVPRLHRFGPEAVRWSGAVGLDEADGVSRPGAGRRADDPGRTKGARSDRAAATRPGWPGGRPRRTHRPRPPSRRAPTAGVSDAGGSRPARAGGRPGTGSPGRSRGRPPGGRRRTGRATTARWSDAESGGHRGEVGAVEGHRDDDPPPAAAGPGARSGAGPGIARGQSGRARPRPARAGPTPGRGGPRRSRTPPPTAPPRPAHLRSGAARSMRAASRWAEETSSTSTSSGPVPERGRPWRSRPVAPSVSPVHPVGPGDGNGPHARRRRPPGPTGPHGRSRRPPRRRRGCTGSRPRPPPTYRRRPRCRRAGPGTRPDGPPRRGPRPAPRARCGGPAARRADRPGRGTPR